VREVTDFCWCFVGKSTRESFAILNKGCLFRVGLIILCVVAVP